MTRWLCIVAVALAFGGCGRTGFELFEIAEDVLDDGGDPITDRCDAVDYLFVIDNSASMADNQRKLIDNFGVLVEDVEASLDTVSSFHLGVVTTDVYEHNDPSCRALGGLVVQTGGPGSSDARCGPYAAGHNYMTEEDDLERAFACAARVGTSGSNGERPLTAAARAIEGTLTEDDRCNAGFVRDDALLLVVVVTDEDEPGAAGTLSEAMTDAKLGYRDNAALVGIVNRPGESCGLGGHAAPAYETIALAEAIEHGFVGSICDDDYSQTFELAVDVVRRACGQ